VKTLEFTFRGAAFVLDLTSGELRGDDGDARKEIERATAIGRQGGEWSDSANMFIPVRITDPMHNAKQFAACIFSIAPHKDDFPEELYPYAPRMRTMGGGEPLNPFTATVEERQQYSDGMHELLELGATF
jgi:hypothetical protein